MKSELFQQGPMIDDRTITPVADQDGNITFSTSDFGGSRFILLKISFK